MFGWFKSLWSPKPDFGPCDQEVYRYFDGAKIVRGDPMAILRRMSVDPCFDVDLKMSQVEGPDGMKAYGRLLEGIRAAFELPDVKAGGLTDQACALLFAAFNQWVEKKNADRPSSSIAANIPVSPAGPSLPEKDWVSTFTGTEPASVEPSPSCSPSTP